MLMHEMDPRGPTKERSQLITQNYFYLTRTELAYFLTRKKLTSHSLVQNMVSS